MNRFYYAVFLTVISAVHSWSATHTWDALLHGDTVTIAVVGSSRADSISAPWPRLMATALDSRFHGQVKLDNEGKGGSQFETINAGFISCLSKPTPPSAIFYEIFTDESNPSDLQNYPDPISYFRAHIQKALQTGKALAPQCDIILWLPYRLCQFCFIPNQAQLLDAARLVATAEGVRIADNWWAFEHVCSTPCCQQYSEFLHDGSHTTMLGGAIVAYEAVNALKDIPRDTTAPIFPCDNVRANSTGYRSALIQWDPISDSVDPQSGIAGYEVFRNGIHTKYCLGRLSTSFIDSSLVEQSDYRYSVFPFNAQLVNGPVSATASILTPADRNPPQLLKAVAYANSHFVTLSFDESIDAHSAMQAESFSVEGFSAIVLKSQLQQDGKSVTFETDSIIANKNASISVVGISDVALTPNRITSPQVLPIATGNVDTGIYFRIVNLLASVGMNISASDLIYSNGNAFSEGTTPHFADTLTPSFPNVGILLKGLIAVSVKGQYRFYISSKADTAEFSIGAAPTRNLSRLSKQDSVTIDLQSGLVPFILALSSINKDSIVLDLQWSGPGFARTPIPDSLLFHETSLAPQTGFHGRFLTPVLGQPINPGDSVSVSWTQENTDESLQLLFEISFSKGKKWQQLLSTAVNSKSNGFIWHVPNLFPGVLLPIDSVFIRASEYGNHDQYVYSSYFRILASSSIKPTSYGHSMVFDKILIHAVQKNNVLISVNASEPGAIKIIDLKGRKVLFASIKKGSNTAQLKISNGIYGFQILNAHFQVKSVGKFALGMN